MVKWQKNVITEVNFLNESSHILKVKRRICEGNKISPPEIISREKVVSEILSGEKFITAYKKEGTNSWTSGDDVGIVKIGEKFFIRTDGNSIGKDNLGNLPEF